MVTSLQRIEFRLVGTVVSLLLALLQINIALASPASPAIHILIQPDGHSFEARQWGNEWQHGWETLDGYTILLDATSQQWMFAELDATGQLASSGIPVNPLGVAAAQSTLLLHQRPAAVSPVFPGVLPSTGTRNLPVLLVAFSDTTPTHTSAEYQSLLFDIAPSIATGPGSLRDYYREISYNALTLSGGAVGVTGWYTTTQTHDYYGANDARGDDLRAAELVREAAQLADSTLNFADYDNDGDGNVDVLVIVHQGEGEEWSGVATDIWSHRFSLADGGVASLTLDGKRINDYIIMPETQAGELATIGVFAHELGHAFGLPDLYDSDGSSTPIGPWSLMAGGSWNTENRSGDSPAHMDAWSKAVLGWVTPQEVTQPLDNETIVAVETNNDVYQLLRNPGSYDWLSNTLFRSGQYFLVENRQQVGFDSALPSSGLLIWHIDESRGTNENEARRLVDLEVRDNNDSDESADADPFMSCDNCFLEVGNPNSDLYDGSHSGVNVVDVTASGPNMTADLLPRQIVFVVDDTGSMLGEIASVRATILDQINELSANPEAEHYSVVTFQDEVTTVGQTANAAIASSWIQALSASGGGDCPEASLEALQRVAEIAPTSEAWLMTDASPHGGPVELATTIATLVANRVKVYPLILSWCFGAQSAAIDPGHQEPSLAMPTIDTLGGLGAYGTLASETGGQLFHVSSAEVAAATDMILSEMDANADISVISGGLSGGSQTYLVTVDGTMQETNFLLNSELSTGLNLQVRYPNGILVQSGDSGVNILATSRSKYYSIDTPTIGVWQVTVSGTGDFELSTSAASNVFFSYLSDTNLQAGQAYLLHASLTAPNPASIAFSLVSSDGASEVPVSLHDDGLNGDAVASDGVYSGFFEPQVPGLFFLKVTGFSDGYSISRVDTIPIAVKAYTVFVPLFGIQASSGFNSQFNGTSSGWTSHSGVWATDAAFYWTNGLVNAWATTSYGASYTNFDYQAKLWRYGCTGCSNQVIVRGNPTPLEANYGWPNYYIFQYNRAGQYSVWKVVNGVATALQPWTTTSAILQGNAWNTLRVFASGSTFYYYINGYLIWAGSDATFSGGRVGLGMYRDSTSTGNSLFVDWATLTPLSGSAMMEISDTISLEQQALNAAAQAKPEGTVSEAPRD